MLKQCSKCKECLPIEKFTKDLQKSDGLRPSCRDCNRRWRFLNGKIKTKEVLSSEYKRCTKCKKALKKEFFASDSSKKDGYYSSCRDCVRERMGYKKPNTKRITAGGYKFGVKKGSRLLLHREIMEGVLGRKLKRTEVVHHKNGDRLDNRRENLQIMTQKEHANFHYKKRNIDNKGQFANES